MQSIHSSALQRILKLLTCALICKVTISVLLNYRDYLPPNFESDFLHGREHYFSGSYSWAFYAHIASGPCTLLLGMILLSKQFRLRFTKWHRTLGKLQIACVVLLVTPSGLWMARYAETGAVAGIGFALLSVATGMCAVFGWRSAMNRRFDEHRCWMCRCYLLLCSAVFLRLQSGLATVADADAAWLYPLAAWTSWLLPLMAFEFSRLGKR